jgi:hypothetical protein
MIALFSPVSYNMSNHRIMENYLEFIEKASRTVGPTFNQISKPNGYVIEPKHLFFLARPENTDTEIEKSRVGCSSESLSPGDH